jgi:biotin carboxyl carrier protein
VKYTVTVGGRAVQVEVSGDSVRLDGERVHATLSGIPQTPLRTLVLNGHARTFAMLRSDGGWSVQAGGRAWPVAVVDERTQQLRELTGQRTGHSAGGLIRAPMPGLVVRVEVEPGQRLDEGAGVVVLEAMKMENEIATPGPGVVRTVHVKEGQAVEKGAPLVEVVEEPEG